MNEQSMVDPSISNDELAAIKALPEMRNITEQFEKMKKASEEKGHFPGIDEEVTSPEETPDKEEVKEEPLEGEGEVEEAQEPEEEEPVIDDTNQAEKKKEVKAWREKKKRYQAEARVRQLESEKEELMRQLTDSLNSGTYHYARSAYADLERAKEQKKQALESSNINDAIEADIALAKAVNAINEIEKWAYDPKYNAPQAKRQEQPKASSSMAIEDQEEIVREWIEYHPYLDVSSPKYNRSLAQKVTTFVNKLDANLVKNGQEDMFYSPEYFDTIDDYVNKTRSELMKPKNVQSVSNVAGVRNSYAGTTGTPPKTIQVSLSPIEKQLAANWNLTEEQYLMAKLNKSK